MSTDSDQDTSNSAVGWPQMTVDSPAPRGVPAEVGWPQSLGLVSEVLTRPVVATSPGTAPKDPTTDASARELADVPRETLLPDSPSDSVGPPSDEFRFPNRPTRQLMRRCGTGGCSR